MGQFIDKLRERWQQEGGDWTEHHQRMAERMEPHVENRLDQFQGDLQGDIDEEFSDWDEDSPAFGQPALMNDGSEEFVVSGPHGRGWFNFDDGEDFRTDTGATVEQDEDGFFRET